jgi:hypothetical protein
MVGSTTDNRNAIRIAEFVAGILSTGRREATYKLATLQAIIDHCAEYSDPKHPEEALSISILDLADRVIALYWHQVLDYPDWSEGKRLSQGKTTTVLLEYVSQLRARSIALKTFRLAQYKQADSNYY